MCACACVTYRANDTMTTTATLSKEETLRAVDAVMGEMKSNRFLLTVKEKINHVKPIPPDEDEVLVRYEMAQEQFFDQHYYNEGNNYGAGGGAKLSGAEMMEQLRTAVKRFPGDTEVQAKITELCTLVEQQLAYLVTNLPELKHLRPDPSAANAAAGGPSAQANQMFNQMTSNPETMRQMQMAMAMLNDNQKATMARVQATMMSGRPPTPEDMREMFLIQQQAMAFVSTMQHFDKNKGGKK